jgi:C4-dicarboxylate-specific signal transduction histidine kinase
LLAAILSLTRQELSARFGDINKIIENLIELRRCALRHQQIELVLELGPKIPALAVDGVKLQKALLNLMFKAEEALEKLPEGRKMAFKTSFDFLNQAVVVSISANGAGLIPDGLATILEQFPAKSFKDLENGFELKEAVQWISEMGGSLKIDPKKGEGPVFEVLLPVKGRD